MYSVRSFFIYLLLYVLMVSFFCISVFSYFFPSQCVSFLRYLFLSFVRYRLYVFM